MAAGARVTVACKLDEVDLVRDPDRPREVGEEDKARFQQGNEREVAVRVVGCDLLAEPSFRERAAVIGRLVRGRLDDIARRHPAVGEVRGLGSMLALELEAKSGDQAKALTVAAREQGLVLLSCGLYGNVIRLLPPLIASDEELERGLDILDSALALSDRP